MGYSCGDGPGSNALMKHLLRTVCVNTLCHPSKIAELGSSGMANLMVRRQIHLPALSNTGLHLNHCHLITN